MVVTKGLRENNWRLQHWAVLQQRCTTLSTLPAACFYTVLSLMNIFVNYYALIQCWWWHEMWINSFRLSFRIRWNCNFVT